MENSVAALVDKGLKAIGEKNWEGGKDCFYQALRQLELSNTLQGSEQEEMVLFLLSRLGFCLTELKKYRAAIYITNRIIFLLQHRKNRREQYMMARANRARLYDILNERLRAKPDHVWLTQANGVAMGDRVRSQMALAYLAKRERRYSDYVTETKTLEGLLQQYPERTAKQETALEKYQMFSYLQIGDYAQGFAYYENRFHFAGEGFEQKPYHAADKKIPFRLLDNDKAIKQKTLLVVGDQGLGDNIMFVRFLPLLKKYCQHIIFEARPEQRRFFSGCSLFKDIELLPPDQTPVFDYWLQLTSLPFHLRLDEKSFAVDLPYLDIPTAPQNQQKYLPPHNANYKNIALVWATGKFGEGAKERSIDIKNFLPVLGCRANFFSFQMGEAKMEIAQAGFQSLLRDATGQVGDFADSAMLLQKIDLVISVDTSFAHLAGALGKKVFLLSPYMTDWKWRDHSYNNSWWYSDSIEIFHQQVENTWQEPIVAVKKNLEKFLQT